jgi:hypothetical protein
MAQPSDLFARAFQLGFEAAGGKGPAPLPQADAPLIHPEGKWRATIKQTEMVHLAFRPSSATFRVQFKTIEGRVWGSFHIPPEIARLVNSISWIGHAVDIEVKHKTLNRAKDDVITIPVVLIDQPLEFSR